MGLGLRLTRLGRLCREVLVGDVVRACRLERAAAAVDAALQCIFQLAADAALQVRSLLAAS